MMGAPVAAAEPMAAPVAAAPVAAAPVVAAPVAQPDPAQHDLGPEEQRDAGRASLPPSLSPSPPINSKKNY